MGHDLEGRMKLRHYIGAMIAFSGFFLLGSYFFYVECVYPWMMRNAAQDWRVTECTIEHSRVQKITDGEPQPSYRPDISYRYTVNGTSFQSDQYSFV